jgi:hypothetical protein
MSLQPGHASIFEFWRPGTPDSAMLHSGAGTRQVECERAVQHRGNFVAEWLNEGELRRSRSEVSIRHAFTLRLGHLDTRYITMLSDQPGRCERLAICTLG